MKRFFIGLFLALLTPGLSAKKGGNKSRGNSSNQSAQPAQQPPAQRAQTPTPDQEERADSPAPPENNINSQGQLADEDQDAAATGLTPRNSQRQLAAEDPEATADRDQSQQFSLASFHSSRGGSADDVANTLPEGQRSQANFVSPNDQPAADAQSSHISLTDAEQDPTNPPSSPRRTSQQNSQSQSPTASDDDNPFAPAPSSRRFTQARNPKPTASAMPSKKTAPSTDDFIEIAVKPKEQPQQNTSWTTWLSKLYGDWRTKTKTSIFFETEEQGRTEELIKQLSNEQENLPGVWITEAIVECLDPEDKTPNPCKINKLLGIVYRHDLSNSVSPDLINSVNLILKESRDKTINILSQTPLHAVPRTEPLTPRSQQEQEILRLLAIRRNPQASNSEIDSLVQSMTTSLRQPSE